MPRVSMEDLTIAAEWLSINEGDEGEGESCQRVRAWLIQEIKHRETEAVIRQAAKGSNVPVAFVRKALKRREMTR